jgi:hypothetical protein
LGGCLLWQFIESTEVAQIFGLLYPSSGTDIMIFKNIFAKKFSEKIGVFDSKQS